MSSLRRHLGELTIDHTASPGTAFVPEGTKLELPHFNCPHCNRVVVMNPQRTRERHYCQRCDRWTCDSMGCVTECVPFLRTAELVVAHPGASTPFMQRGPNGELLFNPTLLDKTRIY